MTALPEDDLDLSWDGDGSMREELNNGNLIAFCAHAQVIFDGEEIADDYLGQCIYKSIEEFRDHIGIKINHPQCGSYFADMIREVCKDARKHLLKAKQVYIRGQEPKASRNQVAFLEGKR